MDVTQKFNSITEMLSKNSGFITFLNGKEIKVLITEIIPFNVSDKDVIPKRTDLKEEQWFISYIADGKLTKDFPSYQIKSLKIGEEEMTENEMRELCYNIIH